MSIEIDGHIKGAFKGWKRSNIHCLDRGSRRFWKQVAPRYRYTYSYRPRARIVREGSRYYLEVDVMDERVEVRPTSKP